MTYIMGGVALLISILALWIAVEARSKTQNDTTALVQACIKPLHHELEALKQQIDQLTQSHNRLVKSQAACSQQVETMKQDLAEIPAPPVEKKKIREPFS